MLRPEVRTFCLQLLLVLAMGVHQDGHVAPTSCASDFECVDLSDDLRLAWRVNDKRNLARFKVTGPAGMWFAFGVSPEGMLGSRAVVVNDSTATASVVYLRNRTLEGLVPITQAPGPRVRAINTSTLSVNAAGGELTAEFSILLDTTQAEDGAHGHRRAGNDNHDHGAPEPLKNALTPPPLLNAWSDNVVIWAVGHSMDLGHSQQGVATWSVDGGLVVNKNALNINASYIIYAAVVLVFLFSMAQHLLPTSLKFGLVCHRRWTSSSVRPSPSQRRKAMSVLTLDLGTAIHEITLRQAVAALLVVTACAVAGVWKYRSVDDLDAPVGRVFGELAVALTTVALLPVTRNSLWVLACGISFERILVVHRATSRLVWICVTVHMVFMLLSDHGGSFVFEDTRVATPDQPLGGGLFGFLAWVCLTLGMLTAHEFVRKRAFWLFQILHLLFLAPYLVLLLLHHLHFPVFFPLGLYFIDMCVRWFRSLSQAQLIAVQDTPLGVHLQIKKKIQVSPGAYVFINIPELSLAWHPFSLASSQRKDGTFDLYVKPVGHWTVGLRNRVLEAKPMHVMVDGPYGVLNLPLQKLSAVVLVAFGVGITTVSGIFEQLAWSAEGENAVKEVHLIWTVRTEKIATVLVDKLLACVSPPGHHRTCRLRIFVTRGANGDPCPPQGTEMQEFLSPRAHGMGMQAGRPTARNWQELTDVFARHTPSRSGVVVCGPRDVTSEVQHFCGDHGVWFHKESFSL